MAAKTKEDAPKPINKTPHTRMVGLQAVGKKGFQVVYREVLPSGEVIEEVTTPVLNGPVSLLSRFQRTLAFKLLHARAWKSWLR